MFKRLKKELNEITNDHMNTQPLVSMHNVDHFNQLTDLSKRTNSHFKIAGTPDNLIIKTRTGNVALVFFLLMSLGFPLLGVIQSKFDFNYWLLWSCVILVIASLIAKYEKRPTNNIEIDIATRQIIIRNNNLIGKYLTATKRLSFEEIEKISFKEIRITSNNGPTFYYHLISLENRNGSKIPIIALIKGPLYQVNHHIFISCLQQLIMNNA